MKSRLLDSIRLPGALAVLLVILVVFALFALRSSPANIIPGMHGENDYSPPEGTYHPTTATATATTSPASTQRPTIPPLTPHPPEGWPTDQPWPPSTATPRSMITPEIRPFPTLSFALLDEKSPDEDLDSLWYPYQEGKNAAVTLEEIKINEVGRRKEQPKTRIDLGFGTGAEYPRLLALQKTSDGAYIAYQYGEREGTNWYIYDLSAGSNLSSDGVSGLFIEFYRWSPDGKYFLGRTENNTRADASLIGIENGEAVILEASEYEGILPEVDDMAFSADGKSIAAALSYHPYSGKNNPWMNEISIWKTDDPASREVLCRGEKGQDAVIHTLKWSPDGQKLLWVGGLETADVEHWVQYLWLADRSGGQCEPIIEMGVSRGEGFFPITGDYTADWSPDGSQIVFHLAEERDGQPFYRIALLDVNSGAMTDLVGPTQELLSNVQFSPAGDLIFYSISHMEYGEIWATSLDGGVRLPVAGPATISAPFWVDKNKSE